MQISWQALQVKENSADFVPLEVGWGGVLSASGPERTKKNKYLTIEAARKGNKNYKSKGTKSKGPHQKQNKQQKQTKARQTPKKQNSLS